MFDFTKEFIFKIFNVKKRIQSGKLFLSSSRLIAEFRGIIRFIAGFDRNVVKQHLAVILGRFYVFVVIMPAVVENAADAFFDKPLRYDGGRRAVHGVSSAA